MVHTVSVYSSVDYFATVVRKSAIPRNPAVDHRRCRPVTFVIPTLLVIIVCERVWGITTKNMKQI